MGPDHHDLIFEVRSRQLGEDVIAIFVVGQKLGFNVDAQLYVDTHLQHPHDHIVMLGAEDHARHRIGAIITAEYEESAMFATIWPENNGCTGVVNGLVHCSRGDHRRRTLRTSWLADGYRLV